MLILDTHVLVRWLVDESRLSNEQRRVLNRMVSHGEQAAVSATTLIEIALLMIGGKLSRNSAEFLFQQVDSSPAFYVLPLTTAIAREIAAMGGTLRDPADQTIVATARVHRLQLVTSDQRIIASDLVPIVE